MKMLKKLNANYGMDAPDYGSFRLQMNGTDLTDSQSKIFLSVIAELSEANVRIVYRGDKKNKAVEKFNLTVQAIPHGFNDYIFLFGEKGRYFLKEKITTAGTNTYGITDTSEGFLTVIFDMLHAIFTRDRYAFPVKASLDKFKKDHPEFIKYFINEDNKKDFVSRITSADRRVRIRARDYYLTLLHHFGKNEFYPVSFLLSATTSFQVAQKYVAKEITDENDIIFFGWVPLGQRTILYTWTNHWREKIVNELGLPTFSRSIYPNQQEISLKGGLLAHYTIGYLYTRNGQKHFEVNPWLFEIREENWPKNGFPVDQHSFDERIKDTLLKRAFFIDNDGDYGEYW
ncbi:hypothetical protein [Chitinophaga tropicalis]|uniref:Uncharacterized protein n=1 Tax=Chitinophaga tropicalis TaxID=2683588 RepID=A0A7K1U596_9BACT|nr:hypothetical protein [Chitinophaga tropicalis]MVT09509.1 hypothetical protein [Chitinophaga tropicalis]